MVMEITEKQIKLSKNLYIWEAALEYFISIMVAGSFLATLTEKLGMSDALTGIISAFISLGYIFQLISIAIRPKRCKPLVLGLSIANQLLFTLLFVIPLPEKSNMLLKVVFVATILLAYLLYYIAHPKKINWFMSLIDDKERGLFTANKEIVSLFLGMIFSFGMGAVVDYFKAKGEISNALILCAVTMFVLTILHTLTMAFSVEKVNTDIKSENFLKSVKSLIKDPNILKVSLLFVLWNIANYSTTPFLATYNLHDLGFSLTLITIFTALGSLARILISRFWGAYADKHSFAQMDLLCFGVAVVAFFFVAISGPENGYFTMAGYNILIAMAYGGINSSMINLVFDFVSEEKRADSLAITQVLGGLAGFVTTLAISPFIDYVQKNNNSLFGLSVYAQQITAAISLILSIVCIVYTKLVLIKPRNPT